MDPITNLPAFIRELGENFAAWRRYQLHDSDRLSKTINRLDPKFSETLLSRFEHGVLADFIQAAADALCISPETFLNPPPDSCDIIQLPDIDDDRDLDEEREIENLSWSKWDRNNDAEKMAAFKVVLRYGESQGLTDAEQDYLARMLIAPPHSEQDKYKRNPKKKCCDEPQVEAVDAFTIKRYDPQSKVTISVMFCTNCGMEWTETKNGQAQQPAAA
jgi:hypothetical protein